MKPGESIEIKAIVLRVDGNRLDAQTPTGQLIQTDVSNVAGYKPEKGENKAVTGAENKNQRSK